TCNEVLRVGWYWRRAASSVLGAIFRLEGMEYNCSLRRANQYSMWDGIRGACRPNWISTQSVGVGSRGYPRNGTVHATSWPGWHMESWALEVYNPRLSRCH